MGVYEPLGRYLKDHQGDSWNANFDEIEQLLGRSLPRSAYEYRPWWANQKGGNHSQSSAWQEAGWETRDVDLKHRTVRFERTRRNWEAGETKSPSRKGPDLWDQAAQISGIHDRDRLMESALTALIQREAGRQLALLGGTMPDLEVPPRERPEV